MTDDEKTELYATKTFKNDRKFSPQKMHLRQSPPNTVFKFSEFRKKIYDFCNNVKLFATANKTLKNNRKRRKIAQFQVKDDILKWLF